MPRATVLVGFAEAVSAPETVWSLVDGGYRVVAFARKGRASALRHSRHVVCHEICAPESDLQASLSDLRSLLNSLGPQDGDAESILFPLDDKAVWLCSQIGPVSGWRLAGPENGCAELALKKNLQVELAREAGFNVPQTVLATGAKDLLDFVAKESFPVILKSADCVPIYQGRITSCRNWICANRDELDRAIAEWGERVPLLCQTFISGVGEGVFGIVASDGVRAWSGHRRIRMMNPEGSGSSACAFATGARGNQINSPEISDEGGMARPVHDRIIARRRGESLVRGIERQAVGKYRALPPSGTGIPGVASGPVTGRAIVRGTASHFDC